MVLVILLFLLLSVSGIQLGLPDLGAILKPEPPLPGVRARDVATIARFDRVSGLGVSPYLAIGADGTLGVTDRLRNVVMRFSPDGQLLSTWGPQLSPDVTIGEIGGIAAYGGNWYVLDRGSMRVVKLDANGQPTGTISLDGQSPYGPNGIAFDGNGNLYVTDTGWNRFLVYGPNGRYLRSFGSPGDRGGEFKQPMDITFGPDGSAFVADWENSRIQRLDTSFAPVDAW